MTHFLAVPDDDERLKGAKEGETQLTDGVMYIRQSDWIPFLRLYAEACGRKAEFERIVRLH